MKDFIVKIPISVGQDLGGFSVRDTGYDKKDFDGLSKKGGTSTI